MSISPVAAAPLPPSAPAPPLPSRPPDDSETSAVIAAAAMAKHLSAVVNAAAGRLDVTV